MRRFRADDRVADGPIGLQSASKGGVLALPAGSHFDDVGAVVSAAGSGVVWEGVTANSQAAGAFSWMIDGQPVPHFEMPWFYSGSTREYYDRGLDGADADTRTDATIPVERVDGPVAATPTWPSRTSGTTTPGTRRPPVQPTYGRSSGRWYELGGALATRPNRLAARVSRGDRVGLLLAVP